MIPKTDPSKRTLILKISGGITIGEGDIGVQHQIQLGCEQGFRIFILDLKNVGFIDSAGIGQLLDSLAQVTRNHGQLALIHVPQTIEKHLRVMSFFDLFQVFDSLEDAQMILEQQSAAEKAVA